MVDVIDDAVAVWFVRAGDAAVCERESSASANS
jgi:hypothetical protein